MKWNKKGQLFLPSYDKEQMVSHASNPVAIHLSKNVFRVFYSVRNIQNKSSVSYLDIDIVDLAIVSNPNTIVMSFGDSTSFFSHGISIGNSYSIKNDTYILFMGWEIRAGQHWRGTIGRLKLIEKKQLLLDPIDSFMKLDEEDKISLSYPFVLFDQGIYKMWYGSTVDWTSENDEMIHVIKYATSDDGKTWTKKGLAIPYEIGVAQAFSKPSVIIDEKGYHMWYSYRSGDGTPYRIGYSYSKDGIQWVRMHTKAGIDVSSKGWDSEMICYPFVFEHHHERYMLYNGNDYGKTGFGLAKFE